MKRFPWLAAVFVGSVLLSGCAGYQLGPSHNVTGRSVWIDLAENQSEAPMVRSLVTQNLKERLTRGYGARLARHPDTADARVTILLTGYEREARATLESDTGRAESFEVFLSGQVSLETGSGSFTTTVRADSIVFAGEGLTQSEYHVMPALCEEFANRAAMWIVEAW